LLDYPTVYFTGSLPIAVKFKDTLTDCHIVKLSLTAAGPSRLQLRYLSATGCLMMLDLHSYPLRRLLKTSLPASITDVFWTSVFLVSWHSNGLWNKNFDDTK